MEWYHWLMIVAGILWTICAIINYYILKKMGMDVVLRGEGGHFWLFFAPYWVIPNIQMYRWWKEDEPPDLSDLITNAEEYLSKHKPNHLKENE